MSRSELPRCQLNSKQMGPVCLNAIDQASPEINTVFGGYVYVPPAQDPIPNRDRERERVSG